MADSHKALGTRRQARVLIIAGSDSGGGAGIQGDIKTVTALGGYAATAITALTAQNTLGVFGIHEVPEDFIRQQITLVLDDIGADALKTGMLHKAGVIEAVADCLAAACGGRRTEDENIIDPSSVIRHPSSGAQRLPLVLDPVMFAKGGAALLEPVATATLKKRLIPLAAVITPNIPEAEHLAGMKIGSADDMKKAAEKILRLGCKAVLLKGGHLDGDTVIDVLMDDNGVETFKQPRLATRHTHGTGCALASAVATGLAQGMPLKKAVERARDYVRKAMENAPGLGKGHGPLGHNLSPRGGGQ